MSYELYARYVVCPDCDGTREVTIEADYPLPDETFTCTRCEQFEGYIRDDETSWRRTDR